ncbi:MAG TPA: endonuclease VIII [Balneolaceae bacterium]
MPEGPEIWRISDTLDSALSGKEVTSLYFAFDALKKYETELQEQKIKNVEARGKAILTFFEDGRVMYSHNQLYGKWYIRDYKDKPKTGRKLRVAIHNGHKSAYLYSASQVEIIGKDEVSEHPYIQKLGPDVLHPETTFEDIKEQFFAETFQNRKLTSLLLDQGFISGIGNYLRSEIMFYAKVSPYKKLKEYSDSEKERLAEATVKLSRRSYEMGSITNDPTIVEALKREKAPRSEYRFFVYKRTGNRCHKCGTVIEEDKIGGRKIYFCPKEQLEEL